MKKFLVFIISIILAFSTIIVANGCSKSQDGTCSYDLYCVLEGDTLDCNLNFTYLNDTTKSVDVLYFCLYPNAFREGAKVKPVHLEYVSTAYPNGVSYGDVEITAVNSQNEKLEYNVTGEDQNILEVKLKDEVKPKSQVKVFISFVVSLANVNHRLGYGEKTINLTGFYPVLCPLYEGEVYKSVYYPSGDPFYTDIANYSVDLVVPSSYVVASSLSPIKTEYQGLKTKYSYSREKVRDIAFILSKDFNVLKGETNDIDVYYYYFNDDEPEESLEVIKDSLNYFSKTFTEYPYSEYVVCQADFIYGGMEYPCLTFIDKNLKDYDKKYCIVHETAHQWWYGLVGVNSSEEGFIDEGLTEFSTLLYLSNSDNYDLNLNDMISGVKSSYRNIRDICVKNSTYEKPLMKRNLKYFNSDLEYVSIAYYRSQIMFYDLYNFMGEKKFLKTLQGLVNNYKYKNVTYDVVKKHFDNKKKGAKEVLDGYVLGNTAI